MLITKNNAKHYNDAYESNSLKNISREAKHHKQEGNTLISSFFFVSIDGIQGLWIGNEPC